MIKGEKESGSGKEELQNPCHWIFDLTKGNSSAFHLEVAKVNLIPEGATNIRPVVEGSVVQETYNFADSFHPLPVRKIHIHRMGEKVKSSLGYDWTTTKDIPITGIKGLIFRIKHPIGESNGN